MELVFALFILGGTIYLAVKWCERADKRDDNRRSIHD